MLSLAVCCIVAASLLQEPANDPSTWAVPFEKLMPDEREIVLYHWDQRLRQEEEALRLVPTLREMYHTLDTRSQKWLWEHQEILAGDVTRALNAGATREELGFTLPELNKLLDRLLKGYTPPRK